MKGGQPNRPPKKKDANGEEGKERKVRWTGRVWISVDMMRVQ